MANTYFQFKQFKIDQDRVAMKVGTDGVLLGAWAGQGVLQPNTILDVGTGTGLIALMMAQRFPMASITAIDLDRSAAEQASENVKCSKWKERIRLQHISLQDFVAKNTGKFDLIACNPPFFSNSFKAPDQKRNRARHDDDLPLADLMKCNRMLLSKDGVFNLIIPFDRKIEVATAASQEGLFAGRELYIRPTPDKSCHRVILSLSLHEKSSEYSELVIEESGRHQYSKEYISLTQDFYL